MTHTATNVEWKQLPGEESTLEIKMPLIMAPTMTSADVSVTVSDSSIIVVKVGGSVIWQCRLYAPIEDEVEWTLQDNKSLLVMEISKKAGEIWPALLNVPMKADDSYFLSGEELDARIARELPALPPVDAPVAEAEKEAEAEAEEKKDGEEATPAAAAEEEKATEEAVEEEKKEEVADATEAEAATEEKEETAAEAEAEEKKEDGEEATPAAAAEEEKAAEAEEEKKEEEETPAAPAAEEKDPLDMLDDDDLLNDALDEVHGEKKDGEKKDKTETTTVAEVVAAPVAEKTAEEKEAETEAKMIEAQIQAELRGIEMETEAITEKLEEMMKDLAEAEEGSEAKTTLTEHVKIASRMLELVRETRTLRSEKATIANFTKVQMCDIQKARTNIGETKPYETEDFQDDYEKELSGLQLFKAALQYLNQDPAVAVHLLRLAAIHHHHAPSVVALFSIYSNVPSSYPRGASLMLQNALRGEGQDVEARTNSRVGDLFNAGTRHFPPIFSMAVHFHQRAALAGNTHSMVSLAQLFLSGECTGDDTMAPSLKRLNIDEKRANYFIQCAVDRGSIVSYLIRAAQYINGTEGMPKSVEMAEKYYKRAINAESSLSSAESKQMRIGARMTLGDLEKLLAPAAPASTTTTVTEVKKTGAAAQKADDDDDIIELRPSTNRNAAPATTSSGARLGYNASAASASSAAAGGVVAAPAKKNTGFAASANKRKASWERAARWGIGAYAVYVLAFPLRLVMLPFFYEQVATVLELFGLGGGASAGSLGDMSL